MLSKWKKKHKERRHFEDIFFDKKRRTVLLRERTITIQLSKSSLVSFKKFLSKQAYLVAGILSIFLVVGIISYAGHVKAEAVLYPQTCLGGWKNSPNAAGAPNVSGHDAGDYTDDNSATVTNALAQIFCSGFAGDIPAKTKPRAVSLQFSWAVRSPEPNQVATTTISSEEFASSTNAIIDAPSDKPSELLLTLPLDGSSSSPTDLIPPSTKEDIQINPTPIETVPSPEIPLPPEEKKPDSGAASSSSVLLPRGQDFFSWLSLSQAYAATLGDAEVATATAETIAVATTATSTLLLKTDLPDDKILEVLYTLDGTSWHSLGKVSKSDLGSAAFIIPIDAISDWEDLSKLQISVSSISTIDEAAIIYLDGLWLSVDYQTKIDAAAPIISASGLYFSNPETKTPQILELQMRNNEHEEELVIRGVDQAIGPLAIYDASTTVMVLDTFSENETYVIQPSAFGEGNYVVIMTGDPNHCVGRDLSLCRQAPDFKGEGVFSVRGNTIPLPTESASSTNATIETP